MCFQARSLGSKAGRWVCWRRVWFDVTLEPKFSVDPSYDSNNCHYLPLVTQKRQEAAPFLRGIPIISDDSLTSRRKTSLDLGKFESLWVFPMCIYKYDLKGATSRQDLVQLSHPGTSKYYSWTNALMYHLFLFEANDNWKCSMVSPHLKLDLLSCQRQDLVFTPILSSSWRGQLRWIHLDSILVWPKNGADRFQSMPLGHPRRVSLLISWAFVTVAVSRLNCLLPLPIQWKRNLPMGRPRPPCLF